jgi:hypothetical protein
VPRVSPLTHPGASASWAFPLAFPLVRSGSSNAVGTLYSPTPSAVTGDGTSGALYQSKTSPRLRRDRRPVDPGAQAPLACDGGVAASSEGDVRDPYLHGNHPSKCLAGEHR